jgi:hypothetical protein
MAAPFLSLMIRAAAKICWIFAALALFSCAAVREQMIPTPLATDLLEQVRLHSQEIKSFVARGEVLLEAPGMSYRGGQTMAAMGSDTFLLKVFTPANAPILYIAGRGARVIIIDFDKRTYRRILVEDGKFQLAKGLNVPTNFFTQIAVGMIPLETTPDLSAYKNEEGDEAILDLKQENIPEVSQSIRVGIEPPHEIKGMVFRQKGKVQYQVSFDHYRVIGDSHVPMSVALEVPAKRTRFTVRYSQILINPSLDPAQLAVEPPVFFREVTASQ